jgi:hypothetical protein
MPSHESFRLHDHQRVAPVEELRKPDRGQTKRGRCPAWPCLAFLEQGELFPEEQILGHQGDTSAKEQSDEGRQLRILQELVSFSIVPTEFLRTTTVGPYIDAAKVLGKRDLISALTRKNKKQLHPKM